MCELVEIEINRDTLDGLRSIATGAVAQLVTDDCSMSVITECSVTTFDELAMVIGRTILNSIIVDSITESLKEKTDETT